MLSLKIALRYLFSKKSHNAVNLLSIISVVGVAVATAAMVVVLSVFNGFSDLAKSKLSMIDPDLLVAPATGKIIADADSLGYKLGQIKGVRVASPIVTEQALIVKSDAQMPVVMLGMSDYGAGATHLDEITIDGEPFVGTVDIPGSPLDGFATMMLSVGVAEGIGLRGDIENFVKIYVPKRRGRINTSNPATAFRADTLLVTGLFRVDQAEYDENIVIVPLETARHLLDYRYGEASAIQIFLDSGTSESDVIAGIKALTGNDMLVLDREQQQQKSFNMISVEKWVTLLMLVFILIITSFNIISAIYILRVEKKGNINILLALGATPSMIRRIFSWQGRLITATGGVIGILLGSLLVIVQQSCGLIKLQGTNPGAYMIESYPVRLEAGDLVIILAIITVIAFLTSFIATLSTNNDKI